MNLKSIISSVLVMASVTVFAQRRPSPGDAVVDQAYRVTQRLERRANRLSDQELKQISVELQRINVLIDGSHGEPTAELVCVSKDNDGLNPYQLAFKTDPVTVVKLAGGTFDTLDSCNSVKAKTRSYQYDKYLICVTKDDDGRNPWMLAILNPESQSLTRIPATVTDSQSSCKSLMDDAREIRNTGLAFCSSKDDDGRAPWVVSILRDDGTITRGQETYSSYADCKKSF